jgi:hypothetical protein
VTPHSRPGRRGEEKILDPTGTRISDPSVVQPVASRYTDLRKILKTLYKKGGTAARVPNLGATWSYRASFTLSPIYFEKEIPIRLET